jgi:hypothetical protein
MSPARRRTPTRSSAPAPAHIADLLDSALRDLGVTRDVHRVQLREAFAEAVGPALSPLCEALSLDHGVLLVGTRSGALAHQLHLESPGLMASLNQRLEGQRVRRMRFTALG